MDTITNLFSGFLSGIGPFFLLLGLLIFVHELGHFLVAKYFGVRVEVFSLGFGKKILKRQWGETTYCISLIPLGGYVKMYGDDPSAQVPEDQKRYAFLHKPVWPRIAIVLAGPLMNLFFAIVLFAAIGSIGEEMPAAVIGDIASDSKAYEAGFRPGDKILQINNQNIPTWVHARQKIEAMGGQPLSFVVERVEKGEPVAATVDVTPTFGENENIFSTQKTVGRIEGLDVNARSTLIGVSNPESVAAKAGLQTLDLITSVNGKKISSWRELDTALNALPAGGQVSLQVKSIEADEKAPERTVSLTIPTEDSVSSNAQTAQRLGIESGELFIYRIKKGSPADQAGLKPKDRLVSVNGKPILAWKDVIELIKSYDPAGNPVQLEAIREGKSQSFEIRPEMTSLMNLKGQEEKRFTVGIVSGFLQVIPETVLYRVQNPIQVVKYGFEQSVQWTGFVVMSLVRLVQGDVSAKNIGGVITIGRVASHSYSAGLSSFLKTMAIISINLFLLNLLPVPILDGGHLVFFSIEALRGAPLSMRKMEIAQQVGLMLLMFLMVFAFFNDISNLLSPQW